MNWKIKALLQKFLALTAIGDRLNHIPVTVDAHYHSNVVIYQTHESIRRFTQSKLNLTAGKAALEIGTGYSLISSIVLSLLGFEKIVTVDVTKDLKFSSIKKQLPYFAKKENLDAIIEHSIFSENEILEKIKLMNQAVSLNSLLKLLNIKYIAPYTFDAIENESSNFDYITSLVVLEHVQPNTLDLLFKNTKKWLKKEGAVVHTINFIDHFANPGIFQDKSISEFNFLRYPDNYWKFWAGNSISYTNRLSYVYYLELCDKHQLNVIDFIGENYRERRQLDLNLIHQDVLQKYNSKPDIKELVKYQRGTLLIKA